MIYEFWRRVTDAWQTLLHSRPRFGNKDNIYLLNTSNTNIILKSLRLGFP